jgi:hypothetical protein
MRVLFVSLEAAAGTVFSGNGVVSRMYTQGLHAAGHALIVLCGYPAPDLGEARFLDAGIDTLCVPVPTWRRLDAGCAWAEFAVGAEKWVDTISAFDPEVMVGVDWSSGRVVQSIRARVETLVHTPLVYLNLRVFHCNLPISQADLEFFTLMEKEMCEQAVLGITLNATDQRALSLMRPSLPLHILHPPLRRDIQQLSDTWASTSDAGMDRFHARTLVTCCCRLSPEKNVEQFVQLMCHPRMLQTLHERGWVPCLIGATVDAAYAQHLVSQLRAAHPQAQYYDFCAAPALGELLQRSALYLHPAWVEAYGMAIMEAAAFGCPTVCHWQNIGTIRMCM